MGKKDPKEFFRAADLYERANGRSYTELEIALPNELSHAEQREMVDAFVEQELGVRHPYLYAIHDKNAALDESQKQPHVHIMFQSVSWTITYGTVTDFSAGAILRIQRWVERGKIGVGTVKQR